MTIKDLKIGETATIIEVGGNGALRQHFLDMGLIQGTEVTVVKYAPMGDPVELRIHGYELTIRLEDAGKIQVGAAHQTVYHQDLQEIRQIFLIRVLVRAASIILRMMKIRFPMM